MTTKQSRNKAVETTNNCLWTLWCTKGLVPECPGSLKKSGAIKSKFDYSLFYWHKDDKPQGLICCHVDNFFCEGKKNFEGSVINVLKKTFKTSQEESENFKYLGLHIEQKQDCIHLDQHMYIDELKEVQICKERKMSKESSLHTEEARQLRGLARQLNWTSSRTRPDMSFGACDVCQ